jgi:hypothetical protein
MFAGRLGLAMSGKKSKHKRRGFLPERNTPREGIL